MKELFERLDRSYVKIASYTCITILITVFAGILLYRALPQLTMFANLFMAVFRPLLIGLVVWYLFYPMVNKIEKKLKLPKFLPPRGIAVFITLMIVLAIILVFLAVVAGALVSNINISSIMNLIQGTSTDLEELAKQITTYLDKFNIKLPNIGTTLTGFFSSLASGASTLFFGIIFGIYFLIDGDRIGGYWANVIRKIFPASVIAKVNELLQDADRCFSGYIRGQSLDAVLVGAVVSIVFSFMHMKYALVVGLLAGVGNLIPYVGPALGYGAVIIVNLMAGDFRMMVIGLVVLEIIMVIDGNIINPKLLANNISVHPLLVIASLLAGGAIGGLLGMLLAVPTGAFLKLQFEKWLARKQPPAEDIPEETAPAE
ncbi:MAG: AI-2E family transporter [Solobacterium sp.]|nr:AI-2E family transporter [Solobacterium sp.]